MPPSSRVRRTCRKQKNFSALLRMTAPLLRKIETAHHKPHLGNIQSLKGMIEPHVEIIKPHLGISKPVEALNTLNKLHENISLLRSCTLRNFAAPVVLPLIRRPGKLWRFYTDKAVLLRTTCLKKTMLASV